MCSHQKYFSGETHDLLKSLNGVGCKGKAMENYENSENIVAL